MNLAMSTQQPTVPGSGTPPPGGWGLVALLLVLGAAATLALGPAAALDGAWLNGPDAAGRLGLVFLTGLTVGGLSCMAVQGGLLAAVVGSRAARLDPAQPQVPHLWAQLLPAGQFLAGKLAAYTLLGAVLGGLGARIPLRLQGWLLVAAGLFMLAMAAQTLGLHPLLVRLLPRPPKGLQRAIRSRSRQGDRAAAGLIGAGTVFLPCGITLAMEALAMASGSARAGALVMAVFTVGTVPLFLVLALALGQLQRLSGAAFRPLAAGLVAAIALFTLAAGGRLLGWSLPSPEAAGALWRQAAGPAWVAPARAEPQELTIEAQERGYAPEQSELAAGRPVRLRLVGSRRPSCTNAIAFPSLGLEQQLRPGEATVLDLPPQPPGRLAFVCGMGMFSGSIQFHP